MGIHVNDNYFPIQFQNVCVCSFGSFCLFYFRFSFFVFLFINRCFYSRFFPLLLLCFLLLIKMQFQYVPPNANESTSNVAFTTTNHKYCFVFICMLEKPRNIIIICNENIFILFVGNFSRLLFFIQRGNIYSLE